MSVTFGWVVQGTRGSGKGSFGVHMMAEYLQSGRRVATNFDLYLEHLPIKNKDVSATRIPDMPSGKHLFDLGQAYDFDPKDPSTFDPSQNGLMVIDEISLFLGNKSDPDFKSLNAFFMLSRKLGWNLIFICQNKEQSNDTFFKSICDKLVICHANGSQRIPYLGKLLEFVGLSGFLPDNHTAFILNGRSELAPVEKEIPYNWRPFKLAYNTYQLFDDQHELFNGQLVDMRASYTLLPASYLTGERFINHHLERAKQLKTIYKKGASMALPSSKKSMSTGNKIKIGLMVAALGVFFYFKNPMENDFINVDRGRVSTPVEQPQPQQLQASSTQNIQPVQYVEPQKEPDAIRLLFDKYKPVLSVMLYDSKMGFTAAVDFYQGTTLVQRIKSSEFLYYGYVVTPSGDSAVFVEGKDFKRRVTNDGVVQTTESDNTSVASNLADSISLF